MRGTCSLSICGLKDGLACEEGNLDFTKCPHFSPQKSDEVAVESPLGADGQRLPWTGRALGLSDMMLATSRSSPVLVGLIGPFNAGKTALLTSMFVHFAKAGKVGPYSFAGSYTLQAWARLKQHTHWPNDHGPSFPPHTPDSAERVPGLLHLAFRHADKAIRDVLFTDAPGEWFTRWIQNRTADNATGARWIAEQASHFLFFVDREALAGPQVGKVRHETLVLARVLSEHQLARPVAVIWAKSDKQCDPEVEGFVREKLQRFFGDHNSFDTDVANSSCLKILELLLQPSAASPVILRQQESQTSSAFLAYTGACT